MKVQLLLLLALVGLLCAFTSASPTADPTELHSVENTAASAEMFSVLFPTTVTGPAPSITTTASAQITTKIFTESSAAVDTTFTETEASSTATAEGPTEIETFRTMGPTKTTGPTETTGPAETKGPETEDPTETESPVTEDPTESESPRSEDATETESPVTEDPTESESPGSEDATETEDLAQTEDSNKVTSEDMLIDSDTEDGLSSGQIVSIVVGALLAVAVTTAVVIVVVRRMGKYSSSKNKKPGKKTLRKKPAKPQECARFWKF